MLQYIRDRLVHLIFLFTVLGLISCGGKGSSSNGDQPFAETPETGQAIPGGDPEVEQISPINTDTGSLPEPVATPELDNNSSIAGLTIPGSEHFIASSLSQGGNSSVKALTGYLRLALERDPDSDRFDPLNELFSVELTGDADWIDIPPYCEQTQSVGVVDAITADGGTADLENQIPVNTLVCSMEAYYELSSYASLPASTLHWFSFQPLSAGIVKTNIVYPAGELPPGTRAATAEVDDFMDPESLKRNLSLRLAELPTIIATEPTWVSFYINSSLHWEFDTALDVVASPNIIVDNWKVEHNYWTSSGSVEDDLSQQCQFTDNLHCELTEWEGPPPIKVSLLVRAPSGSDHSFTASVPLQEGEQDGSDNILNVNFVSHVSTAILQELIDTAEDGDTVELPAGVYVGRLDGRGKRLNIIGAGMSTPEGVSNAAIKSTQASLPTVIQLLEERSSSSNAALIVGLGEESHVSGIELQTRGQGILEIAPALTLSKNVIKPVPGYSHNLNGFNGSSCWLNNRIEEWGSGEGNNCDALINARGGPRSLTGNLFRNNDCRYGIIYSAQIPSNLPGHFFAVTGATRPDYSSFTTSISVSNNTFINNPMIVGLYGNLGSRTMDFRNNLIFGSSLMSSESVEMPNNHELTSSSNLVWNSARDTLFFSDIFTVHAPDLSVDPMFNDPDNGDYTLRPESSAIDSGTMLADFNPNHPFTPDMLSQECQHLAIDGNFDGIAEPDIGALEYGPE